MKSCPRCRLNHQRLNVEIRGNVLRRTADKRKHLLNKIRGGAWSFERALLVAHPEIERLSVLDHNTGETWHVTRAIFDENAEALTLAGKPQLALALRYWTTNNPTRNAPTPEREAPRAQPFAVQGKLW